MKEELEKLSDASLVSCVCDGSEAAFDVLFERYYMRIYALSYRLCGSPEDAQDIAQEAFLRTARALHRFRKEAKFSTWLYRIAANVASDWRKAQTRRDRTLRQVDEIERYNTHPDPVSSEILAALSALSDAERAAVVLTIYEGFTHAEAGRILGCAATTVSWRLFRAKQKLKSILVETDDEKAKSA